MIATVGADTGKFRILNETFDQPEYANRECEVFILVNSSSGSGEGRQLINKFSSVEVANSTQNTTIKFHIYDLFLQSEVEECFKQVNEKIGENINVQILIAGGDGTIQWVLSYAVQYQVNFEKVTFGILPIGTGNDFATSIGWKNYIFKPNLLHLQNLATQLMKCKVTDYDVWQCEMECSSIGSIFQIKNGVQKRLESKRVKRMFTNYFGIGCDARVTYFHQMINAKSVSMKKLTYILAGLKSFFCFSFLSSLSIFSTKLGKRIKSFASMINFPPSLSEQIELSDKNIDENSIYKQSLKVRQSDKCITFLNATQSMEIQQIWTSPHSTNKQKVFKEQKVNDGMLQIVSYRNQWCLVFERCFHLAWKIGQGEGPFVASFEQNSSNQQPLYVHVNGQPYKISHPKSIQVRKCKEIPKGKIKVLARNLFYI